MRRLLLTAALAAPLVLGFAPSAAAEEGPPPVQACGGSITLEIVEDTTRFHERADGFSVTGNGIAQLSDADSSVTIRIPGRVSFSEDPDTGVRTIVLTGHNLLLPETEGQAAAFAAVGLPEIVLIQGRVVVQEEFDPETGETVPGSERVLSYTPHVTDVCALLAE
jgi:hypothetical protein